LKIPGLEELEKKIVEVSSSMEKLRKENEKLKKIHGKLERELKELKGNSSNGTASADPEVLKEVQKRVNRLLAKLERLGV
jgi:predicted  nucleic acid-binding Zn-ribbon protein